MVDAGEGTLSELLLESVKETSKQLSFIGMLFPCQFCLPVACFAREPFFDPDFLATGRLEFGEEGFGEGQLTTTVVAVLVVDLASLSLSNINKTKILF